MKVRFAGPQDLTQIVDIHVDRFKSFFLSTLGKSFLKVYYGSFLKYPGVLLVLEDEGEIKGFASGCPFNRGFYSRLLRANVYNYAFAGIKLLITKPKALLRIFVNMNSSAKEDVSYAELLSIATVKNKKGYGSILLKEFEEEIRKLKEVNGIDSLSLTTDYEQNGKAVEFYRINGYREMGVFESYEKRKMFRFIKKL